MLKSIELGNKVHAFNIEKEQDQIKYALGRLMEIDPHLMEDRHWALEAEWKAKLHRWHNFSRCDELAKLLIL